MKYDILVRKQYLPFLAQKLEKKDSQNPFQAIKTKRKKKKCMDH